MTLLEQYAGMAMQGILSGPFMKQIIDQNNTGRLLETHIAVAKVSVTTAQFLIEELKKHETI